MFVVESFLRHIDMPFGLDNGNILYNKRGKVVEGLSCRLKVGGVIKHLSKVKGQAYQHMGMQGRHDLQNADVNEILSVISQ